jgi:DNA-binding response OmpR family regulator
MSSNGTSLERRDAAGAAQMLRQPSGVDARIGRQLASRPVSNVLIATDADWIFDEVAAALADDERTVTRVRRGADVLGAVLELQPELVVLDLQIGNMGGMATCITLRQDAEAGRIEPTKILMLLDRDADVFLARRADADGWLIKPIDAFRLRKATAALARGEQWTEGVPADAAAPLLT